MNDSRQKLKSGFTTGTAAAAAAKGALTRLLENRSPAHVAVQLLNGQTIQVALNTCVLLSDRTAECTVIKDGGDDPDVTNGAVIGARVTLPGDAPRRTPADAVVIKGGRGVGRVTKPGLEVPPGEPAINPGPRRMITQSARDVLKNHPIAGTVTVEVFVPDGEELARKTLNARLGILGGISILGTTGVVTPMSHEAYTATIEAALSVARACGQERAVLTTGRRSERYAQYLWPSLPEEAFIQIGDYFQFSLFTAAGMGFKALSIVVFFGKAVKMAQGMPHTHAAQARLSLSRLSQWVRESCGRTELAQAVECANTARQAFDMIRSSCPAVIEKVGREIIASARSFAAAPIRLRNVILDYEGGVAYDSDPDRTGGMRI